MTAVLPFDPAEEVGEGRTIIEASAGTGKTFTIAAIVARLIAVEGVDLERILVVTFTRAATAELKGRVRRRLVETLRAFEGGPGVEEVDEHLEVLATLDPDARSTAAGRLRAALTDFDRAQIFTIHGFAQRLLGQLGFRVRLPETLEPGEVDDLVLSQVASDLVVARFSRRRDDDPVMTPREASHLAGAILGHPDAAPVPSLDEVEGPTRSRIELARKVAAETQRRMRSAGTMTFDDGLIEVRDVLADPELGEAAGGLLRRRFEVGLIDESQDTDPIQWDIIRRIFDGSRLVVIGDPKQSIYSFRGADIEAYHSAVSGAAVHRTLTTNWRSDGPLIRALDTLFQGTTFGDDRIEYRKVEPAPPHRGARIQGVTAPLHLRLVDSELDIARRANGNFIVGACREAVAADAASRIVDLLEGDVRLDGENGDQPVGPADIAVLCRTRAQVDMVRTELRRRQVPSVAARTGGVLVTSAAEEWRRFLVAVERPDRLDLVRLASSTLLVGQPLASLAGLDDDAALDLQRRLREWNETLHDGGVPALVAALNRHTGMADRLLALPDGERLLTDVAHIAEELHTVFRRGRYGSLAAWLETAMEEATRRERRYIEEPESRQRRLETDAEAVTVQTIHGAKGLQYPVVLVPYAWDVSIRDQDYPVFHDPEPPADRRPRRRLIDIAGPDSPRFEEHRALARAEETAEESRLLYVALTRAQHHMLVWWVEKHERIGEAKLTELLTGEGRTPHSLAAASGGTIDVTTMTELPTVRPYRAPVRAPRTLETARWDRTTDGTWRRVSFSSLAADQPLAAAEDVAEHPLRADEGDIPDDGSLPAPPPGDILPLAELPAGARFGTLVHDILEKLRFDAPDLERTIAARASDEMRTAGWDFEPGVLASGLAAVLATPLGPEPDAATLADLEGPRLAREMTFELPVRTGDEAVTLGDIGRMMDRYLPDHDPYRGYVDELVDLSSQPFRGFLAGAIDLVAVLPGDRYVVMDYKSNSLPATGEAAAPADYGPRALAAEMVSHRYALQATLYQVALHRYLQWRLRGYDPATHLGGSIYLFIRGMIGTRTPTVEGERTGVARWRPPPELIVALSELLAGDRDA